MTGIARQRKMLAVQLASRIDALETIIAKATEDHDHKTLQESATLLAELYQQEAGMIIWALRKAGGVLKPDRKSVV